MKLEEEKKWQEPELRREANSGTVTFPDGWFSAKKNSEGDLGLKSRFFYKVFVFSRVFIEFKIEEKFRELIQDKKFFSLK